MELWSNKLWERVRVCLYLIIMCLWYDDSVDGFLILEIQLKFFEYTIVNDAISVCVYVRVALKLLCVSPFIFVSFEKYSTQFMRLGCSLICSSHTYTLYCHIFFYNYLTFKFSTVQIVLCTLVDTHTSTFEMRFFSLYFGGIWNIFYYFFMFTVFFLSLFFGWIRFCILSSNAK